MTAAVAISTLEVTMRHERITHSYGVGISEESHGRRYTRARTSHELARPDLGGWTP
jgi:hypothetical protein